jgi:hypothetical protein
MNQSYTRASARSSIMTDNFHFAIFSPLTHVVPRLVSSLDILSTLTRAKQLFIRFGI